MRYIIDRLEGDLALCEDELKKIITIPRSQLPDGLKEGDIVMEKEGVYTSDPEETARQRKEMRKKLMDLFE